MGTLNNTTTRKAVGIVKRTIFDVLHNTSSALLKRIPADERKKNLVNNLYFL